jgi:hypothetical protein
MDVTTKRRIRIKIRKSRSRPEAVTGSAKKGPRKGLGPRGAEDT